MEVLCIIPARGGSKAVPKKNLLTIGGKSLLHHAAECLSRTQRVSRTIISTDSEEIANSAKGFDFEVPFIRPEDISKDQTTDWPVFDHALRYLEKKEDYHPDIVVHLRLTSPFAFKRESVSDKSFPDNWKLIPRANIIDTAISQLEADPHLDAVRSVEPVADTPYKMWKIKNNILVSLMANTEKEFYNQPRQVMPQVFRQNGYADVVWARTILEKKSMTGEVIGACVLDSDYFIDIDQLVDVELGNLCLNQWI